MNIQDIDLIRVLDNISVSSLSYEEWIEVGMALKYERYSVDDFINFSKYDSRFKEKECINKWNSFKGSGVTGATILSIAKEYGYIPDNTCFKATSWKERIEWFYANKYSWEDSDHKKHNGYGEGVTIKNVYDYIDSQGKYLYSKVRLEGANIPGKLIRYYYIDRLSDKARPIKNNELTHVLYNLPSLIQGIKNGSSLYIVEGEKDVETLQNLKGFSGVVTTPGSATDWKQEYAEYFKGCNVIILRDNDSDGERLADKIKCSINGYALSIKVVNVSGLNKGDVTDYLTKEHGNLDSLMKIIDNTDKLYPKWIHIDSKENLKINQGLLAEFISEHEHYKVVRLPEDDKDTFYIYRNGVYTKSNKNSVKAMIREYIPSYLVSENLLNNIYGLLVSSYNQVCSIDDLDSDTRYINLKNGLYDIKDKKLVNHTPDIISTIQLPFDYAPDNARKEVFTRYINDLCTNSEGVIDEDKKKVIQEYMGLIISNDIVYKTKKSLVLVSILGNSGKSVLISLIELFFGLDKITSINLTELTPDNHFVLGRIPTTRVITCGDESNTNVKDSSIFKRLTGGDSIKVESKGRQGFAYKYTGGIVLACNGLPCFTDDHGSHLFDRLLIIPCEHNIEESKRDSSIIFKLRDELPGIFNWSLEGLHRLIDNNYKFSKAESCDMSKDEYRQKMDNLYRFIRQKYVITGKREDKVERSTFDDDYHNWIMTQDNAKEVSKANIPSRLEGLGVRIGKGNHNNNMYYGIRYKKPEETDFIDLNDNDIIPY